MSLTERDALREQMLSAWEKAQAKKPLTLIESQITDAIAMHPEYHALFSNPTAMREQEFATDNNPFLHISLHIGLAEQIKLNRPAGIQALYPKFLEKKGDEHSAAHAMIHIMADIMWQAQQNGVPPSDETYLNKLQTALLG